MEPVQYTPIHALERGAGANQQDVAPKAKTRYFLTAGVVQAPFDTVKAETMVEVEFASGDTISFGIQAKENKDRPGNWGFGYEAKARFEL